jgi:hypothetical protein
MRRTLRTALIATVLAVPGLAAAHPGHGADPSGASLLHHLGEPEHALPLLAAIAVAALLRGLGARRRRPS